MLWSMGKVVGPEGTSLVESSALISSSREGFHLFHDLFSHYLLVAAQPVSGPLIVPYLL